MSGHCIIGTATTAVETGLVAMVEPVTIVRFETPAGIVTCNVEVDNGQVGAVSIENVESFLHMAAVPIDVARLGSLKVDIAYGGDYYAIVDADEIGLRLSPTEDRAIVEVSVAVREAVAGQLDIRHPEIEHIQRCYQVMFVSNGTSAGDYKQTIVSPPGAIDRSPCGTGTSARIAKLYAEGRIGINEKRLFEGILGTCFEAWVNKAEERNGMLFIKPVIRGRAYITGYHHFVLAENDPFPAGFAMGPGGGEAPF
jgi:proline racemase